jgi:prephenate dehydratase
LKRLKIGFQGEHGAYSEQAIFKHFGLAVQTVPCRSVREVFSLTEAGTVDLGLVPTENTIEGTVYETSDMLLTSSVKVIGEEVLRVVHCLIGLPGSKLGEIESVYSHPQALGQCRNFIVSLGAEPMVTYDTAGSVKMIKEHGMMQAAAIASERAAEIYGLKVLKKGIEDYGRNFTRFIIISKNEGPRSRDSKTSIIFAVPHTPGSLYNALEAFADEGINLTKIESRPTRQRPWEYYLFVDFEGHRKERKITTALGRLATKAVFLKVLGSYPRSREELL